jgi:hypothetical protein
MANDTKLVALFFLLTLFLSSCKSTDLEGVYVGEPKLIRHCIVLSDSSFILSQYGSMVNDTMRGKYYREGSELILLKTNTGSGWTMFPDTVIGKLIGRRRVTIDGIEFIKQKD